MNIEVIKLRGIGIWVWRLVAGQDFELRSLGSNFFVCKTKLLARSHHGGSHIAVAVHLVFVVVRLLHLWIPLFQKSPVGCRSQTLPIEKQQPVVQRITPGQEDLDLSLQAMNFVNAARSCIGQLPGQPGHLLRKIVRICTLGEGRIQAVDYLRIQTHRLAISRYRKLSVQLLWDAQRYAGVSVFVVHAKNLHQNSVTSTEIA